MDAGRRPGGRGVLPAPGPRGPRRRSGRGGGGLGCGPGPQTLALADIGFESVIGVDTSQELLDELAAHARSSPAITTINANLVQALPDTLDGRRADIVVCMRDTVLHLPDRDAVIELCDRVTRTLAPGGAFVLTYRDLTQPLHGLDRFMPVRSDDERIMLCVLEYENPDTVTVNDLIYARGADGWQLSKSSYPKLRLAPDWVRDQLARAGLHVGHHSAGAGGMWSTVATASR